ncbi:MAG: DUF2934 domain-containing protein [Nitrospira sp.]|nr:DUF2934 domain-containing protein [Nitrospira sp.]
MKTRQSGASEKAQKTETQIKHEAVVAEAVQGAAADSNGVRDRIAARAYALYEERGYRQGGDLQDWLDAEQEILSRQLAV